MNKTRDIRKSINIYFHDIFMYGCMLKRINYIIITTNYFSKFVTMRSQKKFIRVSCSTTVLLEYCRVNNNTTMARKF